MIETLGVAEAKRRFSELVDRVRGGERFLVARHGRPAVALVPPDDPSASSTGRPRGFLSLAGILADWSDDIVDQMVADIYTARRRAKDRPPPDLG